MKLGPPDSHHLNAAQGWLELGDINEAKADLDRVRHEFRHLPEVLEVRWQIAAKQHKWNECVEIAVQIVDRAPKRESGWIQRSYALHEMKRTREALDCLLPATGLFPDNWLIQYNLACYCCQLDEPERALVFLAHACRLGDSKEIKAMALNDSDLKSIWSRI
jgi:predicted Zn-dependent protease